jgi:hypothetical protein
MPISVISAIINPCTSLGGASCINLENKTLLCLIVKKLEVFVINHERGGD